MLNITVWVSRKCEKLQFTGVSILSSFNTQMQHYYCTVGTETAVGPVTILRAGTTYIRVKWPQPKYSPVKIRVDYQYSLFCEEEPYFRERVNVPLHDDEMNFTGMEPGSDCRLNFAVFYNPLELDRGVNYLLKTLQSSKAYVQISILYTK